MESFVEAFDGYVQDDVDDGDRAVGSNLSTHSRSTTLDWIEGYSGIGSVEEDQPDPDQIHHHQGRASFSSDHSNATTAFTLAATTSTTSPPDSSSSSTGVGETWSYIQTPSPPASLNYDQSVGFDNAAVYNNGNHEFITLGTDGLVGFDQNGFQYQAHGLLVNGGEGIEYDALNSLATSVFSGTGVKPLGLGSYGYEQYLAHYGLPGLNQNQVGLTQSQAQLAGTYGTGPVYILDSQVQYPQYQQQLHQQQQQLHHQQAPVYPNSTAVFRTNVRDKKDWTDITSYAASMFVDNQGGNSNGQQRQQQQQQPQHQRSGSMTSNAGQGQFGSSRVGETGILGGSNFAQAFAGSTQQASEGVASKGDGQTGGMFAPSTGAARGFPVAHPPFGPVMGQSPYQHQQHASEGYYYSQATSGSGAFQPTFAGKVLPAYASVGAVVQPQQPQQQQSQQFQQQLNRAQPGLIVSPRTRPGMAATTQTSVEDYHRAMAAQNVGEMQQLLGGSTATQSQQQQQQQPQQQPARVKVENDVDDVGSSKTIENLVDELDAEVEAALAGPERVSRGSSSTGKSKSTASNRLKSHRSRAPYHRSESTDAQATTDRRQKSVSASGSLSSSSSSPSEGTVISRNILYEDGKPKIRNPFGGGRGYVPGETPDDPSKRHKCEVCGRGFARLFNLKSHAATHDPARKKPFPCPHDSCPRSFSRLHDLERHRQGIHSDGPLMDAKVQGIAPALARAQERIHARETAKANPAPEDASQFADQAD